MYGYIDYSLHSGNSTFAPSLYMHGHINMETMLGGATVN